MFKMKCPIKEEEDQIVLNKCPTIFNQDGQRCKRKRMAKDAKPKVPGVFHKRKHCLI